MTQIWTANSGRLARRGYSTDTFVLGTTRPVLVNPDSPTSNDNVGAAFGWNGVSLTVMNGDQTIPANTTWTNRLIHGYVDFTDSTSRLINSVVDGRASGGAFRLGIINGGSGGYMERCTIRASATAARYYLNGLSSTGGDWTLVRCDFSRVTDSIHVNNAGGITALGCRMHDYGFWDNDLDHASDPTHPYWTHGDVGLQRLSGLANSDWIEGCSIEAYFDATGVSWSGGTWGSGTASGGDIGTPSTALNNGYPNRNYANGITYTSTAPYSGMTFLNNWIDGVNYPSGLIHFPVAGAHSFRLEGNRFGLGGQPGGASNKIFIVSYPTSSTVNFGIAPNVYDTIANVPSSLRGQPLTFTSGGASVIPGDYS